MTSDMIVDLISALALIRVEINIKEHDSFISAEAESQRKVLLFLVGLISNAFIYTSFKKFDLLEHTLQMHPNREVSFLKK